jgi:cytochrome b561
MYSYHKWIGVIVFMLGVARVYWRATHRPPLLPDTIPNWEKLAAHATHFVLYLLIFAIPVSGWLMSSALGFQTVLFEVLPLPDLVARNKELGEQLRELHEALNLGMAFLVLGHIGASLKHHYIDRDDVLVRMVPFLRRRS